MNLDQSNTGIWISMQAFCLRNSSFRLIVPMWDNDKEKGKIRVYKKGDL